MRARTAEYLPAQSVQLAIGAPAAAAEGNFIHRRRRRRWRRAKLRETFHGQILLCRPLQTATCVALECLLSTPGSVRIEGPLARGVPAQLAEHTLAHAQTGAQWQPIQIRNSSHLKGYPFLHWARLSVLVPKRIENPFTVGQRALIEK